MDMMGRIALLSAGLALLPATGRAEDLSALLKAKTQAFSEAGQRGDGKAMGELLDDHVVFVNEGGDMPTKREIVESAQPPQPGVQRAIEVTDWSLTPHGSTAVARFVDVLTQKIGDQTTVYRFLSTEVWQKEQGRWLMISSQTLALPQDPPAVALSQAQLDQYVGDYSMGPGFVFHITRDGERLLGAMNGGQPAEMKAEAVDVLFTPGQPRTRRVFQRDAAGRITGFASRREGHDVRLTRIGA
jgi:hypothetical protein